jgi:hypothetical protein
VLCCAVLCCAVLLVIFTNTGTVKFDDPGLTSAASYSLFCKEKKKSEIHHDTLVHSIDHKQPF